MMKLPLLTAVALQLHSQIALADPATQVRWTASVGDARVGTYVSSAWGFSTNSHWIAGANSVVLIDTQFLPSAALQAVAAVERIEAKKVKNALVLHVNPDKFNGTPALQAAGIAVWTTAEVAAHIPAVHKLRSEWFAQRYAPDYPTTEPKPQLLPTDASTVTLGGIDLKIHRFGLACSKAHLVVEFERHVFVGDLVSPNNHAWLELGAIDPWIAVLQAIAALQPLHVHSGRGPSAGIEAITLQIEYLRTIKQLVLAEKPRKPDQETAISRVKKQVLARYPTHDFEVFLNLGLPQVWNRLAASAAAAGGR